MHAAKKRRSAPLKPDVIDKMMTKTNGLAIVFEDGMQDLSSDTSVEVCDEQCSTVLEYRRLKTNGEIGRRVTRGHDH